MRNDPLKQQALQRSAFRQRFHLDAGDCSYAARAGLKTLEGHARDFIENRLNNIAPEKDGRQTPFKGHPVFKAQHATATCCRKCLEKWHNIPRNRRLNKAEAAFIRKIIMRWLKAELKNNAASKKLK